MTPRETFQTLLRELFQIEAAAELDFGIYRIMGQKRGIIERFIDEELLDVIESELRTGALKQASDASTQLAELATQIRENLADEVFVNNDSFVKEAKSLDLVFKRRMFNQPD